MLDVIFYIIAVVALVLVFKENIKYKNLTESLTLELDDIKHKYKLLSNEFDKLEKVDIKQRYDINNLKAFKTEAARLRLLLKKVKDAYANGKLEERSLQENSIKYDMDKLLKDEVHLLKEQEDILKEEERLLSSDNSLLQEENELLTKEVDNLKKQISELRVANKKIPKYIETINELNDEVSKLIESKQ